MKEKIKLLYRIIIVIVTAIGLYLNFKFLTFEKGILYFTNLSNLLCLIYFTVLVILMITKKLKRNNTYYIVKGMVTMSITLTMVVYNLLLSSSDGLGVFTNHQLECNLVHIVVPLLVIFDYIFFAEKGHLKKEYPFIWSTVLIAYELFVIIYSSLGGTFIGGIKVPYVYMDVEKYGLFRVLINVFVVYIFFIGFGNIVLFLDNKFSKNQNLTK